MTVFQRANEWHRYIRRAHGESQELAQNLTRALENGEILIPQVGPQQLNYSGGVNHCPNSDLSYSKDAATVAGTLPATAGDGNQEAYRFFRQVKGANVGTASADALKAVDHSLFAANEGATPGIPRWNRVDGWVELGSTGTQYDIAVQLPTNLVGPGQRWFFRFRCVALDAAILPANVQFFAGIWHKKSGSEGYISGDNFVLSHEIHGAPGATSVDYRVLAKTDSGVSVLSDVLTVANSPATLSTTNYIKLYFNAGPGFIEFEIYKKVGSNYYLLFTVRNSTDLQYNDTGSLGQPKQGWPTVTTAAPLAYAETKNLIVAPFGSAWRANDLTVEVPTTYDYTQTIANGQFLRFGLTSPTGVNRHVGVDRVWFSTTYNEWAPDVVRLADGTYPMPTIGPTSGNQGNGTGVVLPPGGGSGGPTCVTLDTPVLTVSRGRNVFRRYRAIRVGEEVRGEHLAPYAVLSKRQGTVSEVYEIETANGVTKRCSATHPLFLDVDKRVRVEARQVTVGMRLACWVKGRKTKSKVIRAECVPVATEVGTFTLRHTGGLERDGDGVYVAGNSKEGDRGLFCGNLKRDDGLFL